MTKSFALRNVTVIDGSGNPARSGITVIVAGNRIQAVDSPEPTAGSAQIDGTGKFLIPGLWDMHVHLDAKNLPLFIPNGVTGIRSMGPYLPTESQLSLRADVAAGKLLGPRVIVPVRMVGLPDGIPLPPGGGLPRGIVVTSEDARDVVRRAVQTGVDFIKVHDPMSRDVFLGIVDEARRHKIPVAGHVPQPQVSLAEASDAGLVSIEHVEHLRAFINNELGGPDGVAVDGLSASQAAAISGLFDLFRRNGTWFCPALTDTPRPVPIVASDSRLRYFDAAQRKRWLDSAIPAGRAEVAQRNYRSMLSFTAALHRAGIGILAGTDSRLEFGMAGFWLHEELQQLVAAGLTPMDALRSATYKPAEFLGLLDSLGTIEPGKAAEMVVLDANPLDDITNTTKINMVFTGGRVYRRPALDAILSAVEANARN